MATSRRSKTVPAAPTVVPRLLTIKDAAAYLSATVWFMRTLVWEKQIPHIRTRRKLLFDVKDLDTYVEQNKVAPFRGSAHLAKAMRVKPVVARP